MDRAVFIYTTWPATAAAEAAGRTLVERRLAACVNILPGMISHYRWEGKVERAEETVMIIKTRASLADAVSDAVKALPSYETPAIVVLPLETSRSYLGWCWRRPTPARSLRCRRARCVRRRSVGPCLRSRSLSSVYSALGAAAQRRTREIPGLGGLPCSACHMP